MTEEMSDLRLEEVMALPPGRRHAWFLQRVREAGQAWGLYAEGWALALDERGEDVLPLWPTQETARRCATKMWSGFEPRSIPLSHLLEELLPGLAEEGMRVGIFFTPTGHGWALAAGELSEQLLGSALA